jgi:hypothetical protein
MRTFILCQAAWVAGWLLVGLIEVCEWYSNRSPDMFD